MKIERTMVEVGGKAEPQPGVLITVGDVSEAITVQQFAEMIADISGRGTSGSLVSQLQHEILRPF